MEEVRITKKLYLFIYLLAVSDLSCGMRDLHFGAGSFLVVHGLLSSFGVWVFFSLVATRRLQGMWALYFVARGL